MRIFSTRFLLLNLCLFLLLATAGCKIIDMPSLISSKSSEDIPEITAPPQQLYRDLLSVGTSEVHREFGFVRVYLDFKGDALRTVSFDSFDIIGQLKTESFDYAPHQEALALTSHLKSLGPSRIAEIDAVSGATVTVNAIKQAAIRAEQRARLTRESTSLYYDGSYMGISNRNLRGWTTAIVTIMNDRITHVTLQGVSPKTEEQSDGSLREITDEAGNFIYEANGADYPWKEYHHAIETLEKRFVEANIDNIDSVDAISRATTTSIEAKQAIQNALQAAKR